ncbi:DUF4381 domain-containing protein [Paracoccus ravus]|uniref:DUF4381 domain-containing protein n=1 Tax=Paracoccus ravus TaxID=2447760 RepID=UPI00106E60C5|nr:DUF4381 domain-containing protein [Paracoccus ravus]
MEQETPPGNDSLIGLIDQLVEPAAPAPISMMPQTWGWAVVAFLFLAALAYGAWRFRRYRLASAYRRDAMALLRQAGDDPAMIAEVLRRTALAAYPRDAVASLSGADWLAFLDRQIGGEAFSQGPGRIVATAPYRPARPDPGLSRLAAHWITQHRAGAT